MRENLRAAGALWSRELRRFFRERGRLEGALLTPIVFWVLLGGGLAGSFRHPEAGGAATYLAYLFPGILALVLLFSSVFSSVAIINDRQAGFLQAVLVAPISRPAMVAGMTAGGATVASVQALLLVAAAPWVGIPITPAGGGLLVLTLVWMALSLTALGFAMAWVLDSPQAFHAVMTSLLLPLWLISGALFPLGGASTPVQWVMRLNPLTYEVALLRQAAGVGEGGLPPWPVDLGVTLAFGAAAWLLALAVSRPRRSKA